MDEKNQTELNVNLKLYYFDIPGRAESLRLALTYGGFPFEDYRFKDRQEFVSMKNSGDFMFGQVPALQVTSKASANDVFMLNQTRAIIRFIGKLNPKTELYPADPIHAAIVDAIMDQESDVFTGYIALKYSDRHGFAALHEAENGKLVESIQQDIVGKILPGNLGKLEAIVKKGGTVWMAGTQKPSIADFYWAPILKTLGQRLQQQKLLEPFPLLAQMIEKFYELEAVKAYYRKA